MSDVINIALVGCGIQAEAHFNAWKWEERGKIIAVVDKKEERAKRPAKRWSIAEWFTDYHDILRREDIDAVDLCLPHHLHAKVSCEAAEAGKHILVEKPEANSLKEAECMIEAADKGGVKLMVAEHWRFVPIHLKAYELLNDGSLGEVFMAKSDHINLSSRVVKRPLEWATKIETIGGGVLLGALCHPISLLRMYFGEVDSVLAAKTSLAHVEWFDSEIELNAIAVLKFENGVIADVTGSGTVRFCNHFQTWLFGDKASLYMDIVSGAFRLMRDDPLILDNKVGMPGLRQDVQGFIGEVQHFIDCILKDEEPITSGREEKKTLKVIFAAYKSMKERRLVKIDEIKA